MALLTKDEILAADDLPTEDVEVPEWGGTVRVRTLTGAERDRFEESITQVKGGSVKTNYANLRARLVALCAVDEQGRRLFSDADAAALGRKSAAALDRVFIAARRLNGMSDADIEEMTSGFPETEDGGASSID